MANTSQKTPRLSLHEFQEWERVDSFKYEWYNGQLLKFESIKTRYLQLVSTLLNLFDATESKKENGLLVKDQGILLSPDQLRRPSFSYFTGQQIENAENEEPIPGFIIELAFTSDLLVDFKNKLKEYFKRRVKVVWLIYPDDKLVEIYTSYKNIQVCSDGDLCSAKPVLPDFEIEAANLFE